MPSQANQPLPDGTQLQRYRIQHVLAICGFSFVYLAEDDEGRERHQPVILLDAEHDAFLHQRMLGQAALDFQRIDPLAADLDQIVGSTLEEVEAVEKL